MSPKNVFISDSIREASCLLVLANPNASDASPRPVKPASVLTRRNSQTVRAVARTGSSSSFVTRRFGAAAIARGHKAAAAATAPPAVRNVRRSTPTRERILIPRIVSLVQRRDAGTPGIFETSVP
jgi:hypothetical protein